MRKILGERAFKAAKKQTMEKLSTLRFVVREASKQHTTAEPLDDDEVECKGCGRSVNLYSEPVFPVQDDWGTSYHCKECIDAT